MPLGADTVPGGVAMWQVVRPTEYGRAFMEAWQASAREDSLAGLNDQERAMQVSQG